MGKIPMKKRERPEQRSITFTKRRKGLFTKAEELCVLCDAQIAMLVTSPNKKNTKIHSYGDSSVFEAFLKDDVPDAVDDETKNSALSLYNECKELEHNMKNKTRNREADNGNWWELENLDNIQSVEVLRLIIDKMNILKENVKIRLNSSKSPKIVTSGSNFADATANHADGNSSDSIAAATGGSNHDNGNGIIINDNNTHDGQSQYDTNYEDFSTLAPLEFFNDYNPSLSCIYGSSFVNMDYNRTVPESTSGFSNTGQIFEGNKQKYDVQQTVTSSSASKYVYNFDQSYVGGEHNTKKADECMGVELKDKEANSWAITAENLPNFGYLYQEVMDGVFNASADSTSNSIFLNVANNDAPLFTDAISTLDCAYQSVNVNPPLSMSIAGTAEYEGLPLSNDWPLP